MTLCKLEPRFCRSLCEDLELSKGLLLTGVIVTSVILSFLVDSISSFAKRLEDIMQFEFNEWQLIDGWEMLQGLSMEI